MQLYVLLLYSSIITVGATVFGGLLALECSWHTDETNLCCAGISRIRMFNCLPLAHSYG